MQLTQIINSQAVPFSAVTQIINTTPPLSLQQNYLGIPCVIKYNYSFTFSLNIACSLNIYLGLFCGMPDRFAVYFTDLKEKVKQLCIEMSQLQLINYTHLLKHCLKIYSDTIVIVYLVLSPHNLQKMGSKVYSFPT